MLASHQIEMENGNSISLALGIFHHVLYKMVPLLTSLAIYILQYNVTYHRYTIHCGYSTKDCYCTVEPNSHHHTCAVLLVIKEIEAATIQIAAVSCSGVGPFSDPLIIANQGIITIIIDNCNFDIL